MKNQAYHMAMLFDFYGDLLTDRQREFYDLYYNDDLSLTEIAENYGISRQGVRDVIVRAEAAMTEIEDKTHLIHRFHQTRDGLAAIEQQALRLLDAAAAGPVDPALVEEAAGSIRDRVQALKQE